MDQPRTNNNLVGFTGESKEFLDALKSKRLHHAWLISGPQGIGKATFCFNIAKYLLSNYKFDHDEIQYDKASEAVKKIEAHSHPDLLAIDSDETEKGTISVEEIRGIGKFLSLTSVESDYRVVIIDALDDLNRNASNALLKLLEEPSEKVIFLLVCHQLGKVLPTVRSRCRTLKIKPLDEESFSLIIRAIFPEIPIFDISDLYKLSKGSIEKAVVLMDGDNLSLHQRVVDVMKTKDKQGIKLLSKDAADPDKWEIIANAITQNLHNDVLNEHLNSAVDLDSMIDRVEKMKKFIEESKLFHLDKGQLVAAILS